MPYDLTNASIKDRFDHLLSVISGERFIKMQGLGNEVPFFICPYNPKDSNDMENLQKSLISKLDQINVTILDINLYDLTSEMLKNEGDFEWLLSNESSMSKRELQEELQSILDVEEALTPAINKKMQDSKFDVMFVSGVGNVFPYIRSHNILNNLQKTAKEKPTVMFFPGEYSHSQEGGASLNLFGKLSNDKYYRAFNIYHVEATS